MRIITLDDTSMKDLLADMLRRDPNNYDSYTKTVEAIVENVKNRRDEAVFEYTKEFDQADLDASNIRVTREEIDQAMAQVDEGLLGVMKSPWTISAVITKSRKGTAGLTRSLTAPYWARRLRPWRALAFMCRGARQRTLPLC